MKRHLLCNFVTGSALLAGGCTTATPSWQAIADANPAPLVQAVAETEPVGTGNADAADDPAIWRNPANPAESLIVGTDKKAGLYLYGLDGRRRHFVDAGRVNNVDLVEFGGRVIVAASDRNDVLQGKIALFQLDPAAARLLPLGTVAAGPGEAYGICLGARGGVLDAFVVMKDGTIAQVALDLSGTVPAGRIVRTLKLATQSEGCVVDPRSHSLFVGEEDAGVWRFDSDPAGSPTPIRFAGVDGKTLVADVEGVAIAGDHLIVSSQGDNAYAAFTLADGRFVGRFRIGAGRFGATSETDGIAAMTGDFGAAFPGGLFVAQDGDNAPAAQNFKLVPWADVAKALGLPAR
jgi:3-phytase